MQYLEDQLAKLTADVTDTEASLRQYLEKEGIPSVQQEQQTLSQEMALLETQRRVFQQQKDNISRAMAVLLEPDTVLIRERWIRRLMATPDFVQSQAAGGEPQRLELLTNQRNDLLTRMLPNNRDVQVIDNKIEEAQNNIQVRTNTYLLNLDQRIAVRSRGADHSCGRSGRCIDDVRKLERTQ